MRAARYGRYPGLVVRFVVVALVVALAVALPSKSEDQRVGPFLAREITLGKLADSDVIYRSAGEQYDGVRVLLPSLTPTRREVIEAIQRQTGLRAYIYRDLSGATVLFGAGSRRILVRENIDRPNKVTAGNSSHATPPNL